MRIKCDFYADGFREGIVEIPGEMNDYLHYSDSQKKILLAEKLVEHLPNRSGGWKIGGTGREDNSIIFITSKILQNDNE